MGGAGTSALHLARGLAARGHDVEVFTAAAEGEVPDPGGAVVHRLTPTAAFGNAPLIPALATLRGFDVVHLHHPFIFGTEFTLLARLRSPASALVVSYHNRLIGEGTRRALFWVYEETWGRALMRAADRIAVVSRGHAATVSYLRSVARRRPSKLAVVPNGVDVETFTPGPDDAGVREANGIPPEALVGAFVATLDQAHFFKRLDLALDAVARAAVPDLHLLVIGGGEWLDRYRGEAAARGLAARVHFLGPLGHDRLPAALRAADFGLLTSDLESFGIVLIEAMASGLPTVSTDLPGVLEVVRPGDTGVVARRGDTRDLARAIGEVHAMGSEGRRAMGRRGRAECEDHYAWPSVVERLETVYEAAVDGRRARAAA